MVPRRGFEPLRPYGHRPLKTACLPIPPPRPQDLILPISGLGGKNPGAGPDQAALAVSWPAACSRSSLATEVAEVDSIERRFKCVVGKIGVSLDGFERATSTGVRDGDA